MKKLLALLCLTLPLCLSVYAEKDKDADDGVQLFAVATLSDDEAEHFEGDSVLVTVTLYANYTFRKVENLDKALPKIKGAHVRAYNADRRLTQDIATYNNRRYYAVVAEQFVVAFSEVGNIAFPSRKYNVDLTFSQRRQGYSPFDDFFYDSPFTGRQKTVQKKCTSENLKLKVVKRPPKTMHDIERNGAVLM